jgi:hypothetical protein
MSRVKVFCGSKDLYLNKGRQYNSNRIRLLKSRKVLRNDLENQIGLALQHCNSKRDILHKDNESCLITWNQIEDIAKNINEINKELVMIEDEEIEI